MDIENKLRELVVAGGGRVGERDNEGVWDRQVHAAILKIGNQLGPTV